MGAVRVLALVAASIVAALRVCALPASAETSAVPPTDPIKLAAYNVLDTHCSRCHQADKLVGRNKVAKGFGNILKLDELAANPKYIKRGDPDRSLLYHVIVRQEMPSDVFQDGDLDHPIPTDDDLKTLRKWIIAAAHEDQVPLVAKREAPSPNDWQALQTQNATIAAPGSDTAALSPAAPAKPGDSSASVQVASLPHPGEPVPIGRDDLGQAPDPSKAEPSANRDLVYEAQDRLQKLGCYSGHASGVLDSETDAALTWYNAKLGRGETVAAVTPELLEELRSQSGRVCAPACPKGQIAAGMRCIPEPGATASADNKRKLEPASPTHAPAVAARAASPVPTPQAKRVRPPAPSVAVAKASPPRTIQSSPQRKVARAVPLRQPAFRQAAAPRPAFRSAPSESSAASTVSGINGI